LDAFKANYQNLVYPLYPDVELLFLGEMDGTLSLLDKKTGLWIPDQDALWYKKDGEFIGEIGEVE
jgi:hypothetical protein